MAAAVPRTSLLVHTFLLLTVLAALAVQSKAIDCRKFVFAPKCRGIISKRTAPLMAYEDTAQEPQRYSARSEDLGKGYPFYPLDKYTPQASDMVDALNEDPEDYIPASVIEWILQSLQRHNYSGQRK